MRSPVREAFSYEVRHICDLMKYAIMLESQWNMPYSG